MFRLLLRQRLLESARTQADSGLGGSMEGHAAMDMSDPGGQGSGDGSVLEQALTSISHIFVMEWAAVIRDIVDRPDRRRRGRRLGARLASGRPSSSPAIRWPPKIWGPLIGPIVSHR